MSASVDDNPGLSGLPAIPMIYVVILNWNHPDDTIECIHSLNRQKEVQLFLIVVDNGSTDDSVAKIKSDFPDLYMHENAKNLGFSGGMNVGIKVALDMGAEEVLLLNNDTVADDEMLQILCQHLAPDVGVVAPVIYEYSIPEQVWSVGRSIIPIFLEPITRLYGGSVPAKPTQKTFLTGCALLVKRSVFEEVGLFDECFRPAYFEDLDFCMRILRADVKMLLVPQAKLWHKGSASSGGETNPKIRYLMARNGGIYFRKHMKWWNLPFVIPYRLGRYVWASLRLFWRRDWVGLSAYWRGLAEGWFDWGKVSNQKYLAGF